MVDNLRALLGSSISEGSKKTYQRAWSVYSQFCRRFGGSSLPTMPLDQAAVALFISYLSASKLAPSTISSYISAISYAHKLKSYPDPTKSFLIRKLLSAQSRRGSPDVRLPITRPVLHELISSLGHTTGSAYQRTLYTAMFLIAFYGFFRVGEIAAKTKGSAHSILQFRQLQFLPNAHESRMAKITISEFKHNTSNRPFEIIIQREDSQPFCPLNALIQYCMVRGSGNGPLFCFPDASPVTVGQFNTELHRCLIFCGLDVAHYKSHSFRIGAASHAAEMGFTGAQIRTLGRWKSDAFRLYIRNDSLHAN